MRVCARRGVRQFQASRAGPVRPCGCGLRVLGHRPGLRAAIPREARRDIPGRRKPSHRRPRRAVRGRVPQVRCCDLRDLTGGSGVDRGRGTVLTIGHSNHTLEVFLALLAQHRVTVLADVRSAPYSRFNPHFNGEPLAAALETAGLGYVYLGRELGGRSDDRSCYENGRIRYDRLARTARFRAGLERVVQGAPGRRLALMCAEREPLHCHRTLLVGRALAHRGVAVGPIQADGGVEPHRS
ncbi:MAG: DUF488 domain-containing protein, partial [Gammaproteobacteria bacterium]|nr:DUF488 domain-containing protein [Gammaproteobacteria bacterium]